MRLYGLGAVDNKVRTALMAGLGEALGEIARDESLKGVPLEDVINAVFAGIGSFHIEREEIESFIDASRKIEKAHV